MVVHRGRKRLEAEGGGGGGMGAPYWNCDCGGDANVLGPPYCGGGCEAESD